MSAIEPGRRAVITGVGVVSPNGVGASAFLENCTAGVSGLKRYGHPGLRTSAVGAVGDDAFDPHDHLDAADVRRTPRLVPMAVAAAREALQQAGLDLAGQPDRVGVLLGTGGGGLEFVERQYKAYFTGGKASPFTITSGTHGNLSSELSIHLGAHGPSHVITTGCASSTDALGYARLLLAAGLADAFVVGGADTTIAPGILGGFEAMKVVSTRHWDDPAMNSRPFSADRDGFVLGEGAWMFVVEAAEAAEARGARPLAELAGYGSTCDAFHRVQIAPDAKQSVRAMQLALADAQVRPEDVGYVNLHGTGTDMNDRMETAAVRQVFGPGADGIPMSSTKSLIGHPQGACGAAGVAATVLGMRAGRLHPTLNLTHPDPACDLDYIPAMARDATVRVALCNCIAFGSKNSALVVKAVT